MKPIRILSIAVLAAALSPAAVFAAALCGDTNESGTLSTSDALAVLRKAVGQPVTLNCPDYIDRYGEPADFHLNSLNDQDYLLGQQIQIEHAAKVTHLGFIAREGGTQVKMALYTDVGGEPGQLVVGTGATDTVPGAVEVPVTPHSVTAGKYWIVGVYSSPTLVAANENAGVDDIIKYRVLTFATALPATFGATFTYGEARLNYWVKVEQ